MKRPPLELMRLERLPGIPYWLSLRRYPRKGISLATVSKDKVRCEIFLSRAEIGPIAEALIRELSSLSR